MQDAPNWCDRFKSTPEAVAPTIGLITKIQSSAACFIYLLTDVSNTCLPTKVFCLQSTSDHARSNDQLCVITLLLSGWERKMWVFALQLYNS